MRLIMGLIRDRGRGNYLSPGAFIGLLVCMGCFQHSEGNGRYGYFSEVNNSQVLLTGTVWDVVTNNKQTEFSFRTCSDGELLFQSGTGGDFLRLHLINNSLEFQWKVSNQSGNVLVAGSFNSNEWFNVNMYRLLGNLYLNVSRGGRVIHHEIISNSTFRTYITDIDLSGSMGLYVGQGFTGCFMEGVNVIFSNNVNIVTQSVIWSNQSCTQSDNTCANIASGDINDCYSQPCIQGTCVDGQNNFTCVCPHLYNGTLCENDLSQYGCLVDPCLNGGTCIDENDGSRNYRCDCVNGFVGINCESDVDECESYPCEHGTRCIDKIGNYECNCTGSGFNGTNCDKDINECNDPGVCGTNGQCFNNQGSYTCQCQDGFFGPACQDVDECLSNPCRNNGTCQNEENAFSCTCVLGFTGNRCEVDIDDCSGQTCLGTNSECRDLVNGFECVCKPGFSGTPGSCVDIDECSSNPCKNGANCTNLENDYSCQCVAGYTDKSCLTNINECEGNPCQNGATCVDGVNRYSCDCVLGYQGDNCQTNINECDLHGTPCYNGGSCNDLVNGFNCTCAQGFMGERCTININECESNPCGINSVGCTEGRGTFTCECKPGYTGPTCETNIDECNSSPCRNGGSCTDRVNGYVCNCTADWMGTICNQVYNACSPEFENCKNGASCFSVPPSHEFNCTCLSGFTGNQCETNIDDCQPDSCTLPKVCYDEVNSFSCRCPIGYEGINCTIDIDECQSNPCQHGSTCTEGRPGTYTCNCGSKIAYIPENSSNRTFVTGYEGVNCENDINECDIVPSICLNRGVCQNEDGGFQCLCGRDTDGTYFTGDHCSIRTSYCYIAEEVKNDQPACKYNGTCTGIIGNYTCDCAPGYTGRRCGDEINECESAPCQYNGTCNDEINGYTCDCVPGITGINCEVNIQECDSNPCLYGNCIDGINRYECNCTDTGFKGDNCEINIDDCESNPCIHGSNCTDKIKDYLCSCLPGYEGKNCEIDINECLSNPCQFNSSCHQKSNETLYQIDYPGFENLNFTYEEAAGYLCECVTGSTGVNCEINIDDCLNDSCSYQGNCIDLLAGFRCECYPGYEGRFCQIEIDECDRFRPCMHGSTCVDKVADYQCNCAPEFNGKIYAGKNCTFELTACENNKCEQGICEPYLIDETQGLQDYRCRCYNGYTGQFCNFSTTISFYSGSYIAAALNGSLDTELSFKFRTTLQDAVLLVWLNDQLNGFFVTVELARGQVCMFYGSYSTEQCIQNKLFNTADWHTVFVQVTLTTVQLTVSSSICQTEAECTLSSFITSTSPSHNVTFGSIQGTNIIPDAAYGSQFVGCMQDITVNRERLSVPYQNPLHSYINLVEGCVRELQCFIETCHEKGTCVDLWTNFRCDCYRPYLGTRCTSEHKAATFAYNGSESSATFSFDTALQNELQTTFDLSFFMRSRQPDGLMMYFGSNTDFVSVELETGHITVRISMCNLRQRVTTENGIYSDGEQHLIRLRRNETNFMFYVGDILQYHTPDLSNNCQFSVTSLHLGGKNPFVNNRKRRQALIVTEDTNIGNFDFETDFKGTIQDIQLNGNSLELFPLDDPALNPLPTYGLNESSGLQEGEVTDPTCDIISPCENNSTCHDVFFNDYRCACLLGYRSKNCSDLDFCVTGECPDGSICQSLLDGFECISNATFNGKDSIATYSHNLQSTNQISVFSFKFRTLSRNGKILEIGTSSRYYRAHLTGSQLMILYKLDDTGHETLVADYSISDSRWYTAEIKELDSEVVLTLKDNQNITLVNVSAPRSANGDSLSSILNASSLSVVVGIDEPFDLRRPYYQGCLGEIRIGNILLPFFPDDQFINNTSQERFLLQQSLQSFVHGCTAGAGCLHSQCRSGSQCVDDYYSYTCTCDVGYTGRWCQDRQDFCTQGDECLNEGHCYSGLNSSMCQCPAGYTGDRCQSDVDECGTLGGACRNGGTCQNENGTFTCNCPTDTLGDRCEANLTETCDSNPCGNGGCNSINITDSSNNVIESFNCSCNIGYHGYKCDMPIDNCADLPCKNGANCTSMEGTLDFTCSCPTGYTGSTCDTNIDDCPSEVCQNGGVCVDGFNTSVCNCTLSIYFKGPYCTVDINECEEQQPCENRGLCINLDGRGFTCDCRNTGYNGTYCETDIDECEVQKPCRNGAACTNTIGDYTCNCTDGYEGKDCQTPNCTDIDCTVGTCRIDVITQQWSCDCPQYYEGKYCEIKGLCADEPCNATNTVNCTQNSTFSFDCSCLAGWEGDICSEDLDECLTTTTCLNSATCQNLPGTFNCVCVDGYTGQRCETDIDDCEVQPCKNGGVCTDLIGGFECNCTGTGYSNETCEVDIDECLDLPCSNGGVCQNTNGNYTCACSNGYQGRNCDVKASPIMEEEQDITWFIVGPAIGVVLILIVIGIVCFVNCVRKKRATRGAYSPSRQEVTGSRVELGNVMKKPPLERLI